MPPVEPRGLLHGDEELRAVRVRARVRHRKPAFGEQIANTITTCTRTRMQVESACEGRTGAVVLELEVLVGELGAVDALAAGAVATREVAALNHEFADHTVELAALVAQFLAALRLQEQRSGALCIMMVTLLDTYSILIYSQ